MAKPILYHVAALMLAVGLATQIPAGAASKRALADTGSPGTVPGAYRAKTPGTISSGSGSTPVKPGVPAEYDNTTSTGRELTGPGTHPGEYRAADHAPAPVFDTIHNVRVQPDTTTATGRAWRDSVRGTTGPTRPGGTSPRVTVPVTPTEMPGSGGADPSVPGSGPAR